MAKDEMKREQAAQRAGQLYERLMTLPRPDDLSNNEWAARAGVNTSFFTNLKNGSEPSVGNLRSVLEVVGISLPEFFAEEAQGRLVRKPTQQFLVSAFLEALSGLPKRQDKRAEYLASIVQSALELPEHLLASLPGEAPIVKDAPRKVG